MARWIHRQRRQWIRRQDQPSALYRIWFGVEFGVEFRIVQNFGCPGDRFGRWLRSVRRWPHIFSALLGIEADRRFRKGNRLMRIGRPADEARDRFFQKMKKLKRRLTPAIVRFHARDQLIPGILFDPQFQVSKVIGDRVRRNDFDRIPTGNQIERQLSRTWLRAGDDPCQCHKARVALLSFRSLDAENPRCGLRYCSRTSPYQGVPRSKTGYAQTFSLNRDCERCSLLHTCTKLRWWTVAGQIY